MGRKYFKYSVGAKWDSQAIGVAPSEALMGYRVISQGMLEPDDREVVDVTEVRARMERHNDHYQAEQKQRFDSKRKPGHLYREGDLVLIKITSTPTTGKEPKERSTRLRNFENDGNSVETLVETVVTNVVTESETGVSEVSVTSSSTSHQEQQPSTSTVPEETLEPQFVSKQEGTKRYIHY
ncbi:hypothetical protein TcasGA2_TC031615 [Tribolium castaneum]|uniref:Uncharacterized protein n=1 Tax=Tribolium castaneum TaxID=7070 RepID=A0A139WAJ2_TRICA|nr:hypothetical protein TcasGA2_TC031615 [Tribolium castaneum]